MGRERVRSGSMAEHPVDVLREYLASEFTKDLPEGVDPVRPWCADPQFFPGATGLIDATAWSEVTPGSDGTIEDSPPVATEGWS
jgi:hypothetical protein